MPIDNENGTQKGKKFILKRRFYQDPDTKEVWSEPRPGVAAFVGGVGDEITLAEAQKLGLAPKPRKKSTTKKK